MNYAYKIEGGKPLHGSITIQGSKNAVIALISAALLTSEPVTLENVPEIADVVVMLDIAKELGAIVHWDREKKQVIFNAGGLQNITPSDLFTKKIRGSILYAGVLLNRFRKATIPHPGGDAIGTRALSTHFHALEALGVSIEVGEHHIAMDGTHMQAVDIILDEPSVTATENTILAAVCIPGKTIIRIAAGEPHVQELILMLNAMGARIRWSNLFQIEIIGVTTLHGTTHHVNADELEISSLAILAAATRSSLTLRNISAQYLDAVRLQLRKMGVPFSLHETSLIIEKSTTSYKSFRIQSGLYPKLGSDHLPPFAVLATQAEGASLIHDWLYEDRLRYIPALQKMGANCTMLDPHRAIIYGPTALHGSKVASIDIRSGMTLVIAALVAQGETLLSHVEHLDRGYEHLADRLTNIGAHITRVEE